jgi:hypothetical protein
LLDLRRAVPFMPERMQQGRRQTTVGEGAGVLTVVMIDDNAHACLPRR